MSLKVPDPNAVTPKQKEFITNLCIDIQQPMPNFKTLTFDEAGKVIEELLQAKSELEADGDDGKDTWDPNYKD